jgi:hypothetical protein
LDVRGTLVVGGFLLLGDDAPGEPADEGAGHRRTHEERAGTTAGEAPHFAEQVAGLPVFEPVRDRPGPPGHLPRDVGGDAGGVGLLGHPLQLAGQLVEALRRLPLAVPGLGFQLGTAFTEQVTRFVLGVRRDGLRLLRRGFRHVATAVGGGRREFACFVLGGLRLRRWLARILGRRRLGTLSVCHREPPVGRGSSVPRRRRCGIGR